ncbi:MAG: FAD-dependent oxidoreductase [Bacillus sp. (in: Bacteria)]|nr:FAD-dependent oxidoreductase [Bacillus sp. (in: firmicutes)]
MEKITKKEIQERIFNQLQKKGLNINNNLVESITIDQKIIANRFNAFRGALYGIASNRKKDTFLRPYNKAKDIKNLFFAGGSTHPGGGSPMVVLSGRNVAQQIIKDFGSTP